MLLIDLLWPTVLLVLLLLAVAGLFVLAFEARTGTSTLLLRSQVPPESAERVVREEFARNRDEAGQTSRKDREELTTRVQDFGDRVLARMNEAAQAQQGQFESFSRQNAAAREEAARAAQALGETLGARLGEIAQFQRQQLETFSANLLRLTESNETRLEAVRLTVERKLSELQLDNTQKLEQMRATVDEKLHAALEHRLGESFKLVSERLEQVHSGLGEMRSLATGVGDLKKVLSNIKTRGCWGEVQLGQLLEQMLAPDQFARNVATNPLSSERVEYAVKLPGREEQGAPVWLPIDAKFPQEEYQRLTEAHERGDIVAADLASAALETSIRAEAKKVCEKYLNPPHTTDFAIMFLPTEGLFAEVLRRPGLCDSLQRDYRVALSGPTTLAAMLNSLQMGFRTLAIEKRSSEVWKVLASVQTEFSRFGVTLAKVQKKLTEASHSIDAAAQRSRAVERKLREANALPSTDEDDLLSVNSLAPAPAADGAEDEDEPAAIEPGKR